MNAHTCDVPRRKGLPGSSRAPGASCRARSRPGLSDEQVEYQVRDRLSFSRFLGLAIEDSIPDATTLWLFREKLAKAEMIEKLFDRFDQHLAAKGYMARGGQIIDARYRAGADAAEQS